MPNKTRVIFLLVFTEANVTDPHEQIQLGGAQGLIKSNK